MTSMRDRARFSTWLSRITLGLTLVTFGWVTWNAYAGYRDEEAFQHRVLRSQERRGVIVYLDEVLTMSARMAAVTGDPAWEQRYRRYEPQLDAAIKELIALTRSSSALAPSAATDAANVRLVAMEDQAFVLVRNQRREEARAVLFSPAYEEQKALYAHGMAELLTEVQSRSEASLEQARRRALMSTAGSSLLFVISIAAWIAVIVSLRHHQRDLERQIGERTAALTQSNRTLLAEVAERSRIQQELVEARDTALEATRLKAEFLANMSHEIRTPMNGVIGMTELALGTDLSAEQRDYLDTAMASAETLLTVINDILDFSKMDAGKLTIDEVPFDLRDSVATTVKLLAKQAHVKELELAYEVRPDLPTALVGDSGRLRQVITNLMGNAIKFTEHGEVLLTVDAESQTDSEVVLRFSVSDTGIGIPLEQRDTIFKPFIQADGSTTRKYGGTGLGLAISTNLVALMGGRMWLGSESGRGSTFHFTLPFTLQKASAATTSTNSELRNLREMPVLVIDDNAVNRRILASMLRSWLMKPVLAESGQAGLAAIEAGKREGTIFPLVLIDGQMPDLDGFSVAEAIKKDPELAGTTLVMLTSSGRPGDGARCRELGIAAYLMKPVGQSELLATILAAINTSAGPNPRTVVTRHSLREIKVRTLASPRSLRILLAEDNPVNQKVAERLLQKRGHTVVLAGNGQEALAALDAPSSAGFDLVLMDVQMPGMDGFEATSIIRRKEESSGTQSHLPIIAMTAHAMKGYEERCLAAGMDGYLSKPVDVNALFAAIDALVPPSSEVPPVVPRIPTFAAH